MRLLKLDPYPIRGKNRVFHRIFRNFRSIVEIPREVLFFRKDAFPAGRFRVEQLAIRGSEGSVPKRRVISLTRFVLLCTKHPSKTLLGGFGPQAANAPKRSSSLSLNA
jgi:hypothetical protein